MPETSFRQRKTPGVYVTELNAFPPSIVGVQTAIPGFIGYTEFAEISGKPVFNKPIAINSLVEFEEVFGGGFKRLFNTEEVTASSSPPLDDMDYDFTVDKVTEGSPPTVEQKFYKLEPVNSSRFNLFNSMRLFYDNGGGTCYVVSVGDYTNLGASPGGVSVSLAALQKGLGAMGEQVGPTMLVVPDAVLLSQSSDFSTLSNDMIKQCAELQDRVAILDVYGTGGLTQEGLSQELTPLVNQFQEGIAVPAEFLRYGMAYFPFLKTSVVGTDEINYTSINNITGSPPGDDLTSILEIEADNMYGPQTSPPDPQRDEVQTFIQSMATVDPNDPVAVTTLNNNLTNALPLLQQIENIIADKENVLPPSGAMAGIFTLNDQTRGVWNAPANYPLSSVIAPSVNLNSRQQGNLNVPLNGKAIDVIREFVGRGNIVWGARTLDGNSNDWRYVQVRRTLIFIEQSIKTALDPFVFAANDGKTWATVVSMVSNFLQGLWSQGGLMGATAGEAFTVECGLGTTMTAQDVLEGYMIVQITVQMIRPAEFIELTFKQKMEGA